MSTSAVHRVGIVGLGKMGHPMARHLARAKFDVTGYDIDAHARSQAQQSGITVAANPRAVADRSHFVIIVVGFDSEAEAVLLGRDGIAGAGRRGLIVGIASTVAPSTVARLADSGIVLLDMPLTRGEPAAESGELLVMVGGDAEVRPETMPMPWAEKDMRIVLSEADHLRLALPLCGVVTEVVKSVKIERGWPTPAQRET